jgi:hypothetical protein
MRLAAVDRGLPLSFRARGVAMGVMQLVAYRRRPEAWELPDIMKVMAYRRRLFGRPAMRVAQSVMRGRSEWSVGQRELFAAFVSAHNMCPF